MRVLKICLVALIIAICSGSSGGNDHENVNNSDGHEEAGHHISIVHLNFEHVRTPLILVLWVLLAVGVKVLYHSVEKFAKFCPESCVLIIFGYLAGLVLESVTPGEEPLISFDSTVFFLFLLPPIVLDAGWCMPPRHFFDNVGLILAFAIFGTVINSFGIGLGLHYLIQAGAINVTNEEHVTLAATYQEDIVDQTIGMPGCLLFGSLIAAVDPVAVLAVFDTVHVNEVLHIIVEGESLLNDAVSVVLYKIMGIIVDAGGSLDSKEYGIGFIAFLVISGGGTVIGLMYAVITSVFTRTLTHVRVVEPLVVFIFAYLSYLTAELFHWSGILAIIFCGFGMRHYVEENISRKSHTTIKYFMKMLAVISESVIFMFLGLALCTVEFDINYSFIGFAIILCLFFRAVVVILFVYISNMFRVQKIAKVDQFIMVYGGLRGAISFSLAFILNKDLPWRNLIVTTTFAVIMFTVFIQGITIGPLVKLLHVRTHEKKKPSLNEEIMEHMMAHVMWGFEEVVGKHGENYYRQWFDHIDNTYLMRWFTNKRIEKGMTHGDAIDILKVFHNLEQHDAMEMADKNEVFHYKKGMVTKSDDTLIPANPKAPQMPPVEETVACADPNVRYQKLQSSVSIEEEDHFDSIKSRTFAAMKLNARPVEKARRRRNKLADVEDDHPAYTSEVPIIIPESHHSMPYHQHAPMEAPRHHHHHHGRKGRHHGDHHRRGDKKDRHHGHGRHHHRNKDSRPKVEQPTALPSENVAKDERSPDEVKLYDFSGETPPEVDPRAHSEDPM